MLRCVNGNSKHIDVSNELGAFIVNGWPPKGQLLVHHNPHIEYSVQKYFFLNHLQYTWLLPKLMGLSSAALPTNPGGSEATFVIQI